MNDSVCMRCNLPCEFTQGKAYTGWIHSDTGQVKCTDYDWPCTPILANQLTHFDRWNLNVPGPWED